MIVYLVGNPDLDTDNAAPRMQAALQAAFPTLTIMTKDPNEEWDDRAPLVIIDTVQGIETVTVFFDLKHFIPSPRLSPHDYDALLQLAWMQKIGRLPRIQIIGIPQTLPLAAATTTVIAQLKEIVDPPTEHFQT